jgi:NhaA family Na+:H+ antiporter
MQIEIVIHSVTVFPLFALANAGVVMSTDLFSTHSGLVLAIMVGLVIGKPLGMAAAAAFAVQTGIATKPDAYSWRHLIGATALAGIGFTMSLFVAGQAFGNEADFAAAKIAVFAASVLAACVGAALLWQGSNRAIK